MTFHVGQAPPLSPSSLFHPAYQNATYFVIGLMATGLIALLGIARAGRKRRRFHRELRELEGENKRLADNPPAADAMFAERKARARSLFLEKKLEEAHASFLERRIDEMRQGLRLTEVEKQFDFLPHGLVRGLRDMLRDARVNEWERTRFIENMEGDRRLTRTQKVQVRELVERWYARDSGGRA